MTVDRHANTSAASIPLALDVAVRDGRIKRGQHVLLLGVGGGFTWGSVAAAGAELERSVRLALRSECECHTHETRVRISGPGLAVGRHDGGLRRAPGRARRPSPKRPHALGDDLWALVAEGPAEPLNQTVEHAAADADRGRRVLARVAGGAAARRRRCSPGTASANTRRWWPRARSRSRDALPLVRFRAQAMQEAVPEGVGRDGRDPRADDDAVRRGLRARPRRARWSSRSTSMRRARS